MSYQAYLDSVEKQTGLTPDDFRVRAEAKGLLRPGVKAGEVVGWLKADYGLGHGHAMAVYGTIRAVDAPKLSAQDLIDKHFTGRRSGWRPTYDKLIAQVQRFGDDVTAQAGNSYISLLREGKKFAIVKVSAERLDIGIKLKGTEPSARLASAGKWNSMVTHRVSLTNATDLDREIVAWLRDAYAKAQGR
jgi:predicted transport protein